MDFDTVDLSPLSASTSQEIISLALSEQDETMKLRLFEYALQKCSVGTHEFAITKLYMGTFLKLEQFIQESIDIFLNRKENPWLLYARLQLLVVLGDKREKMNREFYEDESIVEHDAFITAVEKQLVLEIMQSDFIVPQELTEKIASIITGIATSNTSTKSLQSQTNSHSLLLHAFALLRDHPSTDAFARVCMHLGESFTRQDNPKQALEYFYKCVDSLRGSSTAIALEMVWALLTKDGTSMHQRELY